MTQNTNLSSLEKFLKKENELSDNEKLELEQLKQRLINSEAINLSEDNVVSDIEILEKNIPENLSPLEKLRWVYMNLGQLFSYDYRVAYDKSFDYEKPVDIDNYVSRYETCIQISDVLNKILNKIDGIECKIIEREPSMVRGKFADKHLANEVIVSDNGYDLKLLLDLTLDLYLIQSDSLTMHFGYEDDGTGTYDIIPHRETREMDIKLGLLVQDEQTTNEKIVAIQEKIMDSSFLSKDPKDFIESSLILIDSLRKTFIGYHESKQYINMLFKKLLRANYKEFNIHYEKDNQINLKSVFMIMYNGYEKWIIYSKNFGFINTDMYTLKNMLNNGWSTNSETLLDIIYSIPDNKSQYK